MKQLPPEFRILGNCEFEEFDLYWIFYPQSPISRENRQKLKVAGWHLQRHSRTNKEIWVYDK